MAQGLFLVICIIYVQFSMFTLTRQFLTDHNSFKLSMLDKHFSRSHFEQFLTDHNSFKLSMLDKHFSRPHFEMFFFLFSPELMALTFHANCLQRRQFACNVKAYFLEKIRKNIISLSSAEFVQRMVMVNKQRYSKMT